MADHDEYQFTDPDIVGSDAQESTPESADAVGSQTKTYGHSMPPQLQRNAVIAVSVFVLLMLSYTLFVKFYHHKKDDSMQIVPVAATSPSVPTPLPTPTSFAPPSPVAETPASLSVTHDALNQKLTSVEQSQDTMSSDLLAVQSQVSNMNTNINNLVTKMTDLNQQLAQLTMQLNEQAQRMERRLTPPVRHHVVSHKHKTHVPRVVYYVEAVIPGRAWLITTTGHTVTVRVGTPLAGYGVVRVIDAMQGRVLTSTGHVIQFSQDDS